MPVTTAGRPVATIARVLTTAAVFASALGHLYAYLYDGWDFGIIGVLFIVNVVAGASIGILVLAWRHWIPLFLAFGFSGVTLVMFLVARWGSLFGVQDRILGPSRVVCLVAEIVGLIVSLLAFTQEKWLAGARSRRSMVA